jgi:hypothetical protein
MTQTNYVADTDPAFVLLRSKVRESVRTAEDEYRATMAEVVDSLPPMVAQHLTAMKTAVPAKFIRALLPFFEMLSRQEDEEARRSMAILN